MGKSQKKKATRRHNPVRVPESHLPHGLASASSTSSKNEAILPIIQKLGSVEVAERIWACAAVSNLIQNDPSTRRLLQGKNIVGTLITRLSDAVEEVIVEAAGALRNLCIDGGHDICAEMYNKNILAPLRLFPDKISVTLHQFLENPQMAPDGARRLVYEFAENVITIFWCLSETSDKALKAVNDTNLIPFLMAFFQARDRLPSATVVAAAQCLYVLTQENDPAIDNMRTESSYTACLLDIAQSEFGGLSALEEGNQRARCATLRVLVSGILQNISPLPAIMPASSIDLEHTVALPILVPQLSVNLNEVTAAVTQLLLTPPDLEATASHIHSRSDHKTSSQRELDYIEEKLRVTQLSLEILAGICAKLPEPEPLLEENILGANRPISTYCHARSREIVKEDTELDDEMMGAEADDNVNELFTPPFTNGTGQPAPLASDLKRRSTNSLLPTLAGPLIALIHPTALSFPPGPSEPSPHPPTTSALVAIHIRALECLNNLFLAVEQSQDDGAIVGSALSLEYKHGAKNLWDGIWRALVMVGRVVSDGKIFALRGLEKKTEMWETAVGVLWGVARVGRGYLVPDLDQVQALVEFGDATRDDMNKVKCIGALECLAQNYEAIEANKIISTYLLSHISSPSPASTESCLQSASALIDIYSDEDAPYDINFRQGQWVDALTQALPVLRKLVRGIDKRKAGGADLRKRGDEVLENLAAFTKYRRALNL